MKPSKRKFDLPEPTTEATCRACGALRPLSEYRVFRTATTGGWDGAEGYDASSSALLMDFCAECEHTHGTVTLYRRYTAYGTPEIAKAVFDANKTPEGRRTAEQVRLLVMPKPATDPETSEALVTRELQRRELCRRRLVYYITSCMPNYLPSWWVQDLCRRLEKFMRDVEMEKSPRLIVAVPPRHGKLVADSTPVLTPSGWRTHGELRAGDYVFHPSGTPIRVVGVSKPDMATLDVETTDGARVKVHPNHEWTVFDRRKHRWRTMETRELAAAALTHGAMGRRGGRYMYQLPPREALKFPEAELPVNPYLLGVWLGDSRTDHGDFCFCDADAAVYFAAKAVGFRPTWFTVHKDTGVNYTGSRFLGRALREQGLLGHKHIPTAYQHASVAQRLELMAGLVDTDGHVEPDTGRVRIATVSDELRDNIVELARGLGWDPYVFTEGPALSSSGIQGKRPVHYVGFQPTQPIPARLPRKQVFKAAARRKRAIKSVTPAAPEVGHCIQVDSPDGLYLVGRELTPTHNSLTASDMFPSWVLGHHPEWPLILASYAQELPVEFSRNIRDRLQSPEYKAIFPTAKLRPDAKGVEAWRTTENGGVKAIGVGGGLTGFGGKILIADDLIKDSEAASSDTILQNTWNWYQMVFRSRLAPGGGILLIGTRWHWHDPTGRALALDEELAKAGVPEWERENWEVVTYPAIAEHDEYLMGDGAIQYDVPDPSTSLRKLRNKGDALHPERYPLNELKKIRNTLTKSNWSALYQQQPTPSEGDFFKRDDLKYQWLDPAYRPLCRVFMTVDYAIGKKQRNDYTVMGVHALDANDDMYTLEVRRGRWGTKEIVDNVVAMVERHRPEIYAGEQGQIHAAVWPLIQEALDKKRLYLTVDDTLVPIQDKETRARPLQGRTQRHKHFFSFDSAARPEIFDIAEREMLQFPNGVHDDIVDMLSWAARLALNISLPTEAPAAKKTGWKDKLTAKTALHNAMAA